MQTLEALYPNTGNAWAKLCVYFDFAKIRHTKAERGVILGEHRHLTSNVRRGDKTSP